MASRHWRTAILVTASSLLGICAVKALAVPSAERERPILATPEQLRAEELLRRFLADPEVTAFLEAQEARLADTPIARTPDGKARLAHDVKAWTAGLFMRWLSGDPNDPAILLTTDNTPRDWLGTHRPALGAAGDSPDNIYRNTFIDGRGRYEISGRIDRGNPPAQFGIEVASGQPGKLTISSAATGSGKQHQSDMITSKDIVARSDGSFTLTVDDRTDETLINHLTTSQEPLVLIMRDSLADWNQVPVALSIRRLGAASGPPMDYAALKAAVLADLPEYLDFWTNFPAGWMGGIAPNHHAGPVPRDGGWGYQAGVRFAFKPGDVMVVTMKRGGAAYMSMQVCDPFFIAADARKHITSLNTSQARPNEDGTFTFVVSAEDPGVYNWLDTGGLHSGLGVLRWQAVPKGEKVEDYLLEARTMDRATFAKEYANLERIGPDSRAKQRAEHRRQYGLRFSK